MAAASAGLEEGSEENAPAVAWVGLGFSASGRTREAASNAARVAHGRVISWSCARSLGWRRASRDAGSAFCGSSSRMRHQSAAAGWSSGRDPAAAADRRRCVASKPARVRLLNLSASSGRNESALVLGTSAASSCSHCHSVRVSAAASRLSSCWWKIWVARRSWGGPVGRRSLGSTWVAARHTCRSAINSAETRARRQPPRPTLHPWCCGGPGRRAQQQAVIGRSDMVPSRRELEKHASSARRGAAGSDHPGTTQVGGLGGLSDPLLAGRRSQRVVLSTDQCDSTRSSMASDHWWTCSRFAAKSGLTWAMPVCQRSKATCRTAMKLSRWVTSISRCAR